MLFTALLLATLVALSVAADIELPVDNSACLSETATVTYDPAFGAAVQDMITAVREDGEVNIYQFCNVLAASCAVQADDYYADVVTACQNAGGIIVKEDRAFACSGMVGTIPIPEGLIMAIENYPLCVGVSCDPDALPAQIEEAIDDSVDIGSDDVEASLGGNVECQAVAQATEAPDPTTPSPPTPTTSEPDTEPPATTPSEVCGVPDPNVVCDVPYDPGEGQRLGLSLSHVRAICFLTFLLFPSLQ